MSDLPETSWFCILRLLKNVLCIIGTPTDQLKPEWIIAFQVWVVLVFQLLWAYYKAVVA